ncbi:hypothetical protein ACROYT_G007453 [Oculina patagonica]
MHQFPSNRDLREKWVKFVQRHRRDFAEPSKYASLCSAHFEESCYSRRPFLKLEGMENLKMNRVLIKGSIPTRDSIVPAESEVLTDRRKRQLKRDALAEFCPNIPKKKNDALSVEQASCCVSSGSLHEEMLEQDSEASNGQRISPTAASTSPEVSTTDDTTVCSTPCTTPANTSITADGPLATPLTTVSTKNRRCKGCTRKATQLDNSQRQTRRLKKNILELKKTIRELESRRQETETESDEENGNETREDQPTSQYFTWSSTGTDTESGVGDGKDAAWTSLGEATESEATDTEEREDDDQNENTIKPINPCI